MPPLHHLFRGDRSANTLALQSQLLELALCLEHLAKVVLHSHTRECATRGELRDLQVFVEVGARVLGASEMQNSQLLRDNIVELEPIGQQLSTEWTTRANQQRLERFGGARGNVVEQDDATMRWACDAHHHIVIRTRRLL